MDLGVAVFYDCYHEPFFGQVDVYHPHMLLL